MDEDRNIKVLHIVNTYLPRVSGVAINTHAILKELSKHKGVTSIVFAPQEKENDIPQEKIPYEILRYHKVSSTLFYALFMLPQLLGAYRKEKFQILHCHGIDQIYLGYLFKRLVPSTIFIGMFRNDRIAEGDKKRLKRLDKSIASLDKIVSYNPVITELLCHRYPDIIGKIKEIPLGIDIAYYESVRADRTEEKPYILSLGRLVSTKGIDILIRAFSEIVDEFPNLSLYIAGSGKELNHLKALVQTLRLADRVFFLGLITGDEKIRLVKNAEFFAFSSFMGEGFGGVLLEALACGKIVLANTYETINMLIQDHRTGILYERNSYSDMSKKMTFIMRNKQVLEKSLLPSIQETIAAYDIRRIGIQYKELYQDLMKENGRHG
jgi:teichuronic acid biosynthesis glycosyltransferase TuaC